MRSRSRYDKVLVAKRRAFAKQQDELLRTASITILGTLHPNVVVRFGGHTTHVDHAIHKVTFRFDPEAQRIRKELRTE